MSMLLTVGGLVIGAIIVALIMGDARYKEATRPGWEDDPPAQPDARNGLRQGILIPDDDVAWRWFQQEMTKPNPHGDPR